MKARKVAGLDPDGPLRENARKIIDVRADELRSFTPAVLDPKNVEALHDMRIAAKRLRYVLELTAPAFGPEVAKAAKRAKKLQDLLGEIHDCDVTIPRVERHIDWLRLEDAATLREAAGSRVADLDPKAAREAPHRLRYRGLETLVAYLRARRDVLYARFVRDWERQPFTVTVDSKENTDG
jgi:CHAD domain-containing protein